jgi:ATP-binding cassette subfamily B protein
MNSPPGGRRPLTLVQRGKRDEGDDDAPMKPLDWGIVRRLLGYTRPFARKRNALIALTLIRAT